MNALSLDQVQKLVAQFGVAHVMPVRLIENAFGGTAVYSDTFNGENYFVNAQHY